jgi:DNA-binding transcriptional LysR family regulator
MRQGIRDIDFLSDPTAGELNIGCPASIMGGTLSLALERFNHQYPHVALQFDEVTAPGSDFPSLRERKHDLTLARIARPLVDEEHFDIVVLFQDPLLIAADADSKWARRRKIDPGELVNESWILATLDASVYLSVAEAFRARGLRYPR